MSATIPHLDHRGLLPPGRYAIELERIPLGFCTNEHRWRLWDSALNGLDQISLWRVPGATPILVMGGSFFSDKASPEDIEATLIYPQETPPNQCWDILGQWTRHLTTIKEQYRLDFYLTFPGFNNFCDFFQYVGPKTAAAKGLNEKDRRGVIEVLCW